MKKIIGLFIVTLLIATAVLPVVGNMNIEENANTEKEKGTNGNLNQKIIDNNDIMANWVELDKLTASDGAKEDFFGGSVSIDGDFAIVGAPYDDDNGLYSGSSYIFIRIGSTWVEEAKLTASDGATYDYFGRSVSISGDYAVVGAHNNNAHRGSAYVFKRDGGWSQKAKLTASDGAAKDELGISVSISGDYVIAGAPFDDDDGVNSGSAYLFERPAGGWVDSTETAKLTASDGTASDWFGFSVSICGDYAIVGASRGESGAGSAYIFKRSSGGWLQEAKLTASDGATFDDFGGSVSISGDYVVVGAYADDSTGSAYLFERPAGGCVDSTETAKLTASDGATWDWFGFSVSICGDYAIVGAPCKYSGSAYLFERPDGSWVDSTETAKLTASDGAASDYFGYSVSIDGDTALVGAERDTNINGVGAGSAYMFGRKHECCIDIDSITGGFYDTPPTLTVNAILKNTGILDCTDVVWEFTFTGCIILSGPNSGAIATLSPGTVSVSSKIVIGLAIPNIYSFPGTVTVTADSPDNTCPPATMTKELLLLLLLCKVI